LSKPKNSQSIISYCQIRFWKIKIIIWHLSAESDKWTQWYYLINFLFFIFQWAHHNFISETVMGEKYLNYWINPYLKIKHWELDLGWTFDSLWGLNIKNFKTKIGSQNLIFTSVRTCGWVGSQPGYHSMWYPSILTERIRSRTKTGFWPVVSFNIVM
jgi:hypothetical protein